MNCSTPGLPVHHQLPQSTQTHVHRVVDAIQPSHPLSSPSPPALTLNLSQHQGLFSESALCLRFVSRRCPNWSLWALRGSGRAQSRILKAGGKILTFDQLALASPKGCGTVLLSGPHKGREVDKAFRQGPSNPAQLPQTLCPLQGPEVRVHQRPTSRSAGAAKTNPRVYLVIKKILDEKKKMFKELTWRKSIQWMNKMEISIQRFFLN